jgi:CheY-like chemotaxis protein
MKKLLLINPDKDSLAWERTVLERGDLQIFTAATAEEGLDIHRKEKVNLLLTELELPGLGGDELCSRIRRERSLRKVSLAVICGDIPEEVTRAEKCGANAVLVKPVRPEQLNDCVGKLLSVPPRRDCRVLVKAQIYGRRGATTLYCASRNISLAGLLIESEDLLAVGDRISCMFFLPGASQITAVGEIVRATRLSRMANQYGIRFISLYPQVHTEIEKFVSANPARLN